ncbi:hypothetical protein KR222_006286, partial [Zaprionus bogoriensis]
MIAKKNVKQKKGSSQCTRFFDLKKLLPPSKLSKEEEFSRETVFARRTRNPIQKRRRGSAVGEAKSSPGGTTNRPPPVQWQHSDNIVPNKGVPYMLMSQPSELERKGIPICYNVLHDAPVALDAINVVPLARGLRISICVEHTRFPLVGRVSKNMGLTLVPEHRLWNIQWCDNTPHFDLLKGMKRFQQINQFPGMSEICRKDMLSLNLNRMFKMFPGDYRIFPKTWLLPSDAYDVAIYASRHKRTYILKPYSSGQGRGIWLTNNLRTVGKHEKLICQTYVDKPLLIDGFKFDLRVYTLVTSVDPLRIFVYNEGLARFATHKYMPPALGNSNNVYMHLTNYCVNRRNSNYNSGQGNEGGSKRKLHEYNKWLQDHDYSVSEFWAAVDDAIIKTVISAWPVLKHHYHICFPKHDQIQACFQLLGFDILVDWKLKPYILEVNHTPSLLGDETVDIEVKRPLIRDTLNLICTPLVDKEEIIREDRAVLRDRLLRQQGRRRVAKANPKDAGAVSTGATSPISEKLTQACPISALAQQVAWEESHLGNYRRVMPPTDSEKVNYYCKFYDQVKQVSIFKETEASKNRLRINQEQMKQKRLQEELELEKQRQQRKQQERKAKLQQVFLLDLKSTKSDLRNRRKNALIVQTDKSKELQLFSEDFVQTNPSVVWPRQDAKCLERGKVRLHIKCKLNLVKAHRRRQRRQMRSRTRRARRLEFESRQDAEFVQKYGVPQTAIARLEGGSSHQLTTSSSNLNKPKASEKVTKLKKRKQSKAAAVVVVEKEAPATASTTSSALTQAAATGASPKPKKRAKKRTKSSKKNCNWLPEPISVEEKQWQLDWRKQRTEDLNHWQLKEMVGHALSITLTIYHLSIYVTRYTLQLFTEMYERGNLTKNDIKLFPFLLYRILEKKTATETST